MLRLFNRFLIFILLLSVVLYVVSLNRELVTLRLSKTSSFVATAGYIYISIFVTGVLIAGFVSLWFTLKSYLRERRLIRKQKLTLQFLKLIADARSEFASHNWLRAKTLLEKIINQDPENIPARVDLSKTLEKQGETLEALKVLELARSQKIISPELLLRTAELNVKLGNKTAAIDNLALLIAAEPSARAIELARDLSEDLGRLDDALQYQEKLEEFVSETPQLKMARARLGFSLIIRNKNETPEVKIAALTGFIKKYPEYVPALDSLAALHLNSGSYSEAVPLLAKAAKMTGEFKRFKELPNIWLKLGGDTPERIAHKAITAAKTAAHDTKGLQRIIAEYALAETYFLLNKLDDAAHTLEKTEEVAHAEGVVIPLEIWAAIISLRGLALSRMGQLRESSELWKILSKDREDAPTSESKRTGKIPPSPIFSTP